MRTYFEKPRTTVGWKGLDQRPASRRLLRSSPPGSSSARGRFSAINELGVPCGSELLDPIDPAVSSPISCLGARSAPAPRRARRIARWPAACHAGRLQERHRRRSRRRRSTRIEAGRPAAYVRRPRHGRPPGGRAHARQSRTATSSCAAEPRARTTPRRTSRRRSERAG